MTTASRLSLAAMMPALPELTRAEDFREVIPPLPRSLAELELLLRRDFDLTRYPSKSWVLPRAAPDGSAALDVLIVGGGQAGLAAAFGLMQQRVGNLLVIDENAQGQEGPWATYARMPMLRTHKEVGGIELGVPNLSFRAWFEVQHGRRAWDELYKIPTELWHGYLQWYRRVTRIPLQNETRLTRFHPAENGLIAAEIETTDGSKTISRTVWTRALVLATGIEGNGVRYVPDFITKAIPRARWAHTHEAIDFAALAGKTVAVLGGAASAFDNAIMAAEHGATVHLYHRSAEVRAVNPMGWAEFNGYLAHFPDLPPADRWRFTRQLRQFKTGAPVSTLKRAHATANLSIHPSTRWKSVAPEGDRVLVEASNGPLLADFLILGTGYAVDITVKPEFAEHLPLIALWRDVFTPAAGDEDETLAGSPYLGPNFETLEKVPGTAPWLRNVFNFSRGAQMSMGAMPIGLSGIKFGVPRLVQGVTRQLFVSDADSYYDGMREWQKSDDIAEL